MVRDLAKDVILVLAACVQRSLLAKMGRTEFQAEGKGRKGKLTAHRIKVEDKLRWLRDPSSTRKNQEGFLQEVEPELCLDTGMDFPR